MPVTAETSISQLEARSFCNAGEVLRHQYTYVTPYFNDLPKVKIILHTLQNYAKVVEVYLLRAASPKARSRRPFFPALAVQHCQLPEVW